MGDLGFQCDQIRENFATYFGEMLTVFGNIVMAYLVFAKIFNAHIYL